MKPMEPPKPAAGQNPFLDENESAPQPAARPRKAKPPPGIISAGGVDMARAHASNIKLAGSEHAAGEGPKVVLAVETDPRRARTMRMSPGRSDMPPPSEAAPAQAGAEASPWARAGAIGEAVDKSALPSSSMPIAPAQEVEKKRSRGGWLGLFAVVALILLAAGIIRSVRMRQQQALEASAPTSQEPTPPPPVTTMGAVTTPPPEETAAAPEQPATEIELPEEATPEPVKTSKPVSTARPTAGTTGGKAVSAPPPPKPIFKPPFQLPEEKSK